MQKPFQEGSSDARRHVVSLQKKGGKKEKEKHKKNFDQKNSKYCDEDTEHSLTLLL